MHKLDLGVIIEDNFILIAIHCTLEEYRIGYFINRALGIQLKRATKDIDFKHSSVRAMYALYKFCDEKNMCNYFLVNNKFKGKSNKTISSGSLFSQENDAVTTYLVPEFKRVDYFLKIDESPGREVLDQVLVTLNKTPYIATAYTIENNQLKNKQNLIFE